MASHGQCIAVVSGKGGTGKTSFVAGAGAALALGGKRVLCLDCDIGLRNLDLALGLSDKALMDFSDVAQDRCGLDTAVVEHSRIPGLYLLTAPVRTRGRPVSPEQMAALLQRYAAWKGEDTASDQSLDAFADRDSISAYAVDAVKWCVNRGLIKGLTETSFAPKGTASRAQVAVLLDRYLAG